MADLFNECFTPAMEITPNEFSRTFCRVCRNGTCDRSSVMGSKWMQRVSTQADKLFHPTFADPRDPKYKDVAQVDFPSALQQAMRLEISDRKGDWTIPSETDAAILAASLAARSGPPTTPLPEPVAPIPPKGPLPSGVGADLPFIPDDEDGPVILHRQDIRGSNEVYTVTLESTSPEAEPEWKCNCKAFEFGRARPCKHVTYVQANYEKGKPAHFASAGAPTPTPPAPPQASAVRPLPNAPFFPPTGNTSTGQTGVMVDGSAPPPPRERKATPPAAKPAVSSDPWSVPTKADNIIPVGGKVTLGKKP
jgi:hypothetical protein